MYLLRELNLLQLVLSTSMWCLGGWLIAARLYRLGNSERWLVGLGLGLVLENWLANWAARILPLPVAFWAASAATLLIGALLSLPLNRADLKLYKPAWGQWLTFILLTLFLTMVGRGVGIFDDYQNLPTVSLMATGNIPPNFALNPDLRFGYHYFLLLLATQLLHLAQTTPWVALDLARAMVLALTLMLGAAWTYRFTGNKLARFSQAVYMAFEGGVRWLLLLFPASLVALISKNITLIGSGAQNSTNLADALVSPWQVNGDPPVLFPFAFANGVNNPTTMLHGGIGVMAPMIVILLLLTASRQRNWKTAIISMVLISSLALANEVTFSLFVAGMAIAAVAWMASHRSLKLPRSLWNWLVVGIIASLIALVQGGMFTEVARGMIERFTSPQTAQASYFSVEFKLVFPPEIISSHLGTLGLSNPLQLIVALAELGFGVLALPLILRWGWRAARRGRWVEAGVVGMAIASLLFTFVRYSGTAGDTATTRFMEGLLLNIKLFTIPLVWIYARRSREQVRVGLIGLGLASIFGGMMLFGYQMVGAAKPSYSYFISGMDYEIQKKYWDRLEPGALVFDPEPSRAVTVLGRFTRSSVSWYQKMPDWEALAKNPAPAALTQAGFDYVYLSKDYWDGLNAGIQAEFSGGCAILLAQTEDFRADVEGPADFRRLYDISGCK